MQRDFEHRAKSCLTCDVRGVCCTDAHFVNVHITRLEAVAISEALKKLNPRKRAEIYRRNAETVRKYDLAAYTEDSFGQKFACPLFEKKEGCLVHRAGKPLPCIQHACYEKEEDLPPDELMHERERSVERLNRRAFGSAWNWLPLPVWLEKLAPPGEDS